MKLIKYRVTNFRSVKDSGWVEVQDVSALIGVNESGKTNLLLPLWKLNPARDGAIQPTSDYPKRMFGQIRETPGAYGFITAIFDTQDSLSDDIAKKCSLPQNQLTLVQITRCFDGAYQLSFPLYQPRIDVAASDVRAVLSRVGASSATELLKQEESLAAEIASTVERILDTPEETFDLEAIRRALSAMQGHVPEQPAKTSTLVPRLLQVVADLHDWQTQLSAPAPEAMEGVMDLVLARLPKFVYYSNYGNLDSEIYLPHVVENLERTDLGAKEAAKARTLRVLFNFVRLQAKEILELGRDFKDRSRQPTVAEIDEIAEKKRERSILLQSASTLLTQNFKDWWKQGDYRFRFEADGDHFRIWVSDDRRPEEVELESRSTGLQWFLSFYLVFLVESEADHEGAMLLLDEPGLSLHPLAQRDLSKFFDNLAQTNQILYTTHSPFLVDADRLDRVRKVYVSEDGSTKSSPNLRQTGADAAQAGAAYAVYSALNLNVAESLLLGCAPVVVEGASDQHYLTMIKVLLIGAGKISPKRELVFPPAGGTKTLRLTAGILTGRDEVLPVVLLDGDSAGAKMATELRTSLYREEQEKVLSTDQFMEFPNSELEDFVPHDRFVDAVDRVFRSAEHPFEEVFTQGTPVVKQVEAWAKREGIDLEQGWKVDVAKRVKQSMLNKGIDSVSPALVETWIRLFERFSDLAG